MNAQTKRLLESYRLAPPQDSRKLAEFRRALWQSYPVRRRNQLRNDHSQRPFYPELPELNVTRGRTLDVLLAAEKTWNVSPCWAALDRGMSHKKVRDAFHAARRRAAIDSTLDFSTYLSRLLAGEDPDAFAPVAPAPARVLQPKSTTVAALPKLGKECEDRLARAAAVLTFTPLQVMQAAISHFYTSLQIELVTERQQQVTATVQQARATVQDLLPVPAKPAKPTKAAKAAKAAKASPKPTKKKSEQRTSTATVSTPSPAGLEREKMPALHRRLQIVMGNDECSIPECIERLRARHESWVPESKELKAYISLALSTHVKDLFERVKRGVYRVKPPVRGTPPSSSGSKASGHTKPNGSGKPNGTSHSSSLEDILPFNPFSPAAS